MDSNQHEDIPQQIANCDEHGEFMQKHVSVLGRVIKSRCPACETERKAKEQEISRKQEAMVSEMRMYDLLQGALIPKRFSGKTFANYQVTLGNDRQRKAFATCKDYADNYIEHHKAGRCLLLLGKPGTGKTHLAAAIAGQVMQVLGRQCVYRTVPGILQYIKASYDNATNYTEAEAYSSLVTCSLLVIDEIGATKQTEFELSVLFTIINGRYERQLPTVIVSNLMPKELPDAMGERCVDRLREGGGIALVFDWESMRAEIGHD